MVQTLGPYELLEVLGRGATGNVWRASCDGGESVVAIKVLYEDLCEDPHTRARFLQEARVLAEHRLPGVVNIEATVEDGKRVGLVMSLIEGPNLRRWFLANAPLAPSEACALMGQCADGVAQAHSVGIVHRDLKPENVLTTGASPDMAVLVADFGLARLAEASTATRSSRLAGTTDYVAPEVILGARAGASSDVYALGIMLYEAVAGWRPFRGAVAAVMQQHLTSSPWRPDGVPDRLWSLIELAMAKDPNTRPTSASLAASLMNLAVELNGIPARETTDAPWVDESELISTLPTVSGGLLPTPTQESVRRGRLAGKKRLVAALTASFVLLGTGVAWAIEERGDGARRQSEAGASTAAGSQEASAGAGQETEEAGSSSSSGLGSRAPGRPTESTGAGTDGGQGADGAAAAAEAEAERKRQEAAAAAEAERQRQEAAAAAEAEAERQRQEAAAAAEAEAERQRQEAAAAAEAERQRQEAAAAAEAERQRQEAAAAAEAERQRQEAAAAAEAQRKRSEAAQREAFNFPAEDDLNARGSMNMDDVVVVDKYLKGEMVPVVCQAKGPKAYSTNIWDYTADGYWVPDAIVETGTDGFKEGVPRC